MQKKAIRYLRFSSDGQSNSSIEWQDTNTKHWCQHQDVIITDTFIDAGFSAKTFDRPDFDKLYKWLAIHYKQVDYLIVSQLDRFSRDAGEAISLVKKLQLSYNVQIVSVTEGIIYDYHTPGSHFRSGLQLLLAEDDNINRAQKINSGIYIAKSREGRYIGAKAPYGYKKEGTKKDAHLVVVEEEAKIIQFIYNSFLQNHSIMTIYKMATEMGLKKLGNSVIPKIITNPIYSGQQLVRPWKDMPGGLFKGNHQAIVDMITWQQAQFKLKGGNKNKVSLSESFPLRGLLHCHCGRLLTGAPSRGKSGKYFDYYKCKISQHNNLSAKKIHEQLQELLGYLSIPDETIQKIIAKSEKMVNDQLKENKKILQLKKKELILNEEKLHSIETKWIANQCTFETYTRWFNDLTQQRNYLKAEIDQLSQENDHTLSLLKDNLSGLTDMRYLYNSADIPNKHNLLGLVFDHKLYYQNNIYRTPELFPLFEHNLLILNQKKLLEIDEKKDFIAKVPKGGATGIYIEPLVELLTLIQSIRVA